MFNGEFDEFVKKNQPAESGEFEGFLRKQTKGADVASVIDDEFSKLGYGDIQRLSILGDVGRENNWNRDTILGGHDDPKNKKFNRGIISWQGDRREKLDADLQSQGVYGKRNDDEIRGMVRFMDKELKADYPQIYEKLKNAKTTYEASEALREYIKYVPDAPYNTYDPDFRVKNNKEWAEKAKNLGLGFSRKGTGEFESFVKGEFDNFVQSQPKADESIQSEDTPSLDYLQGYLKKLQDEQKKTKDRTKREELERTIAKTADAIKNYQPAQNPVQPTASQPTPVPMSAESNTAQNPVSPVVDDGVPLPFGEQPNFRPFQTERPIADLGYSGKRRGVAEFTPQPLDTNAERPQTQAKVNRPLVQQQTKSAKIAAKVEPSKFDENEYQSYLKYQGLQDSAQVRDEYSKAIQSDFGKSTEASFQEQTQIAIPDDAYTETTKPEGNTKIIKTDDDILDTIAGTVKVDITKRPKGMAMDEFMFRAGMKALAGRYNLTDAEINRAVSMMQPGKFLKDSEKWNSLTDEDIADLAKQSGGSFLHGINIFRYNINSAKTGSLNVLDETVRKDFQDEQTERNLQLYTSNQKVSEDEFGNPLYARDVAAGQNQYYKQKEVADLMSRKDELLQDADLKAKYEEYLNWKKHPDEALAQALADSGKMVQNDVDVIRRNLYDSGEYDTYLKLQEKGYSPQDYANLQSYGKTLENWGLGSVAAGVLGGQANLMDFLGGVTSVGGDNSFDEISSGLRTLGNSARPKDQNFGGFIAEMLGGGVYDLPRIYALSVPGGAYGAPLGFALDMGVQSVGRGESWSQVGKETLKGAGLGSVFMIGGKLGQVVERGAERVLPELSKIIANGVRVGTIGGGAFGLAKVGGSTDDEAIDEAAHLVLADLVFHNVNKLGVGLDKIAGKVIRVWKDGKFRNYVIGKDESITRVEVPDELVDTEIIREGDTKSVEKSDEVKQDFKQKREFKVVGKETLKPIEDTPKTKPEPVAETFNEGFNTLADNPALQELKRNNEFYQVGEDETPKETKLKFETKTEQSKVAETPKRDFTVEREQVESQRKAEIGLLPSVESPYKSIIEKLQDIPDVSQFGNIRTELSRKIVNLYRELYGKEPYKGDLSKLTSALEEAKGYYASEVMMRLNQPKVAAEYVRELAKTEESNWLEFGNQSNNKLQLDTINKKYDAEIEKINEQEKLETTVAETPKREIYPIKDAETPKREIYEIKNPEAKESEVKVENKKPLNFDKERFEQYRKENFPANDASAEYIRDATVDHTLDLIKQRDELQKTFDAATRKPIREKAEKKLQEINDALDYRVSEAEKAFGKPFADYLRKEIKKSQAQETKEQISKTNTEVAPEKSTVKNDKDISLTERGETELTGDAKKAVDQLVRGDFGLEELQRGKESAERAIKTYTRLLEEGKKHFADKKIDKEIYEYHQENDGKKLEQAQKNLNEIEAIEKEFNRQVKEKGITFESLESRNERVKNGDFQIGDIVRAKPHGNGLGMATSRGFTGKVEKIGKVNLILEGGHKVRKSEVEAIVNAKVIEAASPVERSKLRRESGEPELYAKDSSGNYRPANIITEAGKKLKVQFTDGKRETRVVLRGRDTRPIEEVQSETGTSRQETVSEATEQKQQVNFKVGDRVQDTLGRKGVVFEKDGSLFVEQAGSKNQIPLSDKWRKTTAQKAIDKRAEREAAKEAKRKKPKTIEQEFEDTAPSKSLGDPITDTETHADMMVKNPSVRMLMSDVAAKGYEKGKVSSADVIKSYEEVLNAAGRPTPIRTGRFGEKARGIYKPNEEVIRLRTANNIATAGHEVGHSLHKVIYKEVKTSTLKSLPLPVKVELVKLGKALYGSKVPNGGYASEGFAEFMRLYLSTEDASQLAPNALKWFESELLPKYPKIAKALSKAREATDIYRMEGAENRAKANTAKSGTWREKLRNAKRALSRIPTAVVDEFTPLLNLSREANKITGKQLPASEDPFKVASFLRGNSAATTHYFAFDGTLDFARNKVGEPLDAASSIVRGREQSFANYLIARRAQELWAEGINPGMTLEDANFLVAHYDSPQFQLAAAKVYQWNTDVLNYVKEASPNLAPLIDKIFGKNWQNYVPLMREFDDVDVQAMKRGGKGGNPLKRIQGSGRRIKDIFPQMIANTEKLITLAHRQRVLDSIAKLSEVEGMGHIIEEVPVDKVPNTTTIEAIKKQLEDAGADLSKVDVDEMVTFFTPAFQPKGQDPIVPMMKDGKMKWFQVDEELYNTLNGLDLYRLPKVLDIILGAPTRLFRLGTTGLRPAFSLITNPLRDVQTYAMQSKQSNPAKLLANYFVGLAEAVNPKRLLGKSNKDLDLFYRFGANLAQPLGVDTATTRNTAKKLFQGKIARVVTHPIEMARELLSVSESVPRVAEIRNIARQIGWDGKSPLTFDQSVQMGLGAKQVTVDFSAAGSAGKVINQAVPFFNANIQGTRLFAKNMKERPVRSILYGLTAITMPALALWWLNKDKDWYKDMSPREKFTYFNIESGDKIIQIPRGFEWGNTFAVVPETLINSWYEKDPQGLKDALGHIFETTTPPITPQTLKPFKEQWQNRIDFFDRPIVPRSEEDVPPVEQYSPYTTEAAKWLARQLPDATVAGIPINSPRRLDALFRAVGGGLFSDIAGVTRSKTRELEAADIPVIGKLFRRGGTEGGSSQTIEKFYDAYTEAQQRQKSKENFETVEERTKRMVLEDAGKAIKLLRESINQTYSRRDRQAIAEKMREIAEKALKGESLEPKTQAELDAQLEQGEITNSQYRQQTKDLAMELNATEKMARDLGISTDKDFQKLEFFLSNLSPDEKEKVAPILYQKLKGKYKDKSEKSINEGDRLAALIEKYLQ